jgi:HNH endonuclease
VKENQYEVDGATGCWVWSGYRDDNGYARTYDGGKTDWAHRVYYRRYRGPIPDGLEIDHTCTNPPCVNPDHLEPVTRVEHVRRTLERTGRFDLCLKASQLRRDGLTYSEIAEVLQLAGKEHAWSVVQSAINWGLVAAEDIPRPARLTEQDRQAIRELYALGVTQPNIAEWFRVDDSQVSRIVNGIRGRKPRPRPLSEPVGGEAR